MSTLFIDVALFRLASPFRRSNPRLLCSGTGRIILTAVTPAPIITAPHNLISPFRGTFSQFLSKGCMLFSLILAQCLNLSKFPPKFVIIDAEIINFKNHISFYHNPLVASFLTGNWKLTLGLPLSAISLGAPLSNQTATLLANQWLLL